MMTPFFSGSLARRRAGGGAMSASRVRSSAVGALTVNCANAIGRPAITTVSTERTSASPANADAGQLTLAISTAQTIGEIRMFGLIAHRRTDCPRT